MKRGMSPRSYRKPVLPDAPRSYSVHHDSQVDTGRHRSDGRPPGTAAGHSQTLRRSVGNTGRKSSSAAFPSNIVWPSGLSGPSGKPSSVGGFSAVPAIPAITRTRRWNEDRQPSQSGELHSRAAPLEPEAAGARPHALAPAVLPILWRSSPFRAGPGRRKSKGIRNGNAGGGRKSLASSRSGHRDRSRLESALVSLVRSGRSSEQDASVQDSDREAGAIVGRSAGTAENALRMIRQFRRRQYEKAAEKSARGAASAARSAHGFVNKFRRIVQAVFHGGHVAAGVGVLVGVILVSLILTTSVLGLVFSAAAGVNGSTMPASDADIDKAEAYYSGKEADLQSQVENVQTDHPGYDEYDYQIGGIGHNPVALAAYLSAMYGNFTFDDIKSQLNDLFDKQYRLSFPTRTETRTRDVTATDPDTGQTMTTQQTYEAKILTVDLVSQDFSSMVSPTLQQAGKADVYSVYLQNHGNRMYFSNPFAFGWSAYTTLGSDNSAQVDVQPGTALQASLDGTAGVSGDTVIITGSDGLSVTYRHCRSITVSDGQKVSRGGALAQTDSGLSMLFIHNGEHLNPYIFADTGDSADNSGSVVIGNRPIGGSVAAYQATVTQVAAQYGMSDYVNLILAVMEQESGGRGGDPMQAAEGPFNTKYPKCPNGITDPAYSIQCGIQELHQNLQLAGVTGTGDAADIALALQGYNFGSGFISWAKNNGGYTLANAQTFASQEAASLGWSSYGDPYYVPHVLRYYKQ